jgi:dihydroxyacetone kinase
MEEIVKLQDIVQAFYRVCDALLLQSEHLLSLDQAMGDGDLGITVSKIAEALREYVNNAPTDDLGKFFINAGLATNRAGSSTMGTLLASGMMRAGKEARGLTELTPAQLAAMLTAAAMGMQERGKAQLGDKTVLDAMLPAAEAFSQSIQAGESIQAAGRKMAQAAEAGRDLVTPLRSKIGRASWVGERTEGLVDPGCEALVVIFTAIVKM